MAAKSALTPGTAKTLKHNKWGSGEIKRHLAFLTMLLPGLVFLFCFSYMPMPALVLAFKRYQLATPPADYWIQNRFIYSLFIDNEWVGFSNFEYIFNTPDAAMVLRNTLGYNIVFMVLGLILSVALAIMVNELRNRILAKVYHTILFMPYFISWIIVAYVVYAFVSANGVFNQWLKALGQNTINFYSSPQYWPFIFVFCNIWKYTGNNSIIYLATLTGFDQELYEAAAIDGAGKWRQFFSITIPLITPVIFYNLVTQLCSAFQEFNSAYIITQGGPLGSTTLISLLVYQNAFKSYEMGLACAMAWLLFLIVAVFSLVAFLSQKYWVYYSDDER